MGSSINVARARRQHDTYTNVITKQLAKCNVDFEILETEECLPDCCFVEDTCVSIKENVAVLTNPLEASRKEEVDSIAHLLETRVPFLQVRRFAKSEESGGGDVLVVDSKHIFVGDSKRTNDAGRRKWKEICKEFGLTFTAVRVGDSALHLKSLVVFLGKDIGFVAANTPDGHSAVRIILDTVGQAPVYFIDEPLASANMVRVTPRFVVYRAGADVSWLRQTHANITFQPVDMSELNKADGALTCCSVFIQ